MMGILFQIILEFFLQRGRTHVHGHHESYTMVIVHQSCIHAVFLEGFRHHHDNLAIE
jgi:hypothetical protein